MQTGCLETGQVDVWTQMSILWRNQIFQCYESAGWSVESFQTDTPGLIGHFPTTVREAQAPLQITFASFQSRVIQDCPQETDDRIANGRKIQNLRNWERLVCSVFKVSYEEEASFEDTRRRGRQEQERNGTPGAVLVFVPSRPSINTPWRPPLNSPVGARPQRFSGHQANTRTWLAELRGFMFYESRKSVARRTEMHLR